MEVGESCCGVKLYVVRLQGRRQLTDEETLQQ